MSGYYILVNKEPVLCYDTQKWMYWLFAGEDAKTFMEKI